MTDAIITGPGLYVLRNGRPQWIEEKQENEPGWWFDATSWLEWMSNGSFTGHLDPHPYDIIRRATPEEAAKFCGGSDE